jgi:Protein of unknown function (DUF3343)
MENELVMSFDSTQQALRAEMLLEYHDIEIDIRPTPKAITAGCALSIGFQSEDVEQVMRIVISERVEIKGIFKAVEERYEQIIQSTIGGVFDV